LGEGKVSTRSLFFALSIAWFLLLPSSLPSTVQATGFALFIHSFVHLLVESFLRSSPSILQETPSSKTHKMRSDLFALTAAVAGCAVAAPVAQPQWGSWGNGGGWGSNGGWGQAPPPPAGGASAPGGGIAAPTEASPPVVSAPFPTGTGVTPPIGTGVVGTGIAAASATVADSGCDAVYTISTGVAAVSGVAAATGTAPVPAASGVSTAIPAASTGVSSEAPATNSTGSAGGLTGKSTDAAGLNALFVAKGKQYYGTCADPGTLSSSETTDIIKADFGQITPENSMKWDAVEATRGKFTFDTADQTAAFAAENGKMLRCHTLVWHSQLPTWVQGITDKTELTEVIENHIAEVAGHFKGKCFAWVSHDCLQPYLVPVKLTVNRTSSTRSSPRTVLSVSPSSPRSWVRSSSASLSTLPRRPLPMLSSTSTTTTSTAPPTPSSPVLPPRLRSGSPLVSPSMALVRRLLIILSEVQITNISTGSQSHLSSSSGTADALKALAAVAPEVAITELDIAGASAADYEAVAKACLDLDNCVGITAWGMSSSSDSFMECLC
jgi:endo-1,4-beta-xylanase